MKTKKFYHTSVELTEYSQFPKYYLTKNDNIQEIENIIMQYNKSTNINEKIKYANFLPDIIFCKCRFCGNKIINLNFKIKYNKKENSIYHIKPAIYCREINGNKYYLSCCEKCLLEHFKDNPPKSSKYYFMKANKYGQYSFGYSDEDYHKLCSMTVGVTETSMIKKWGIIEGKKRWKIYCEKQSKVNTYEFKKEKYGWTKQQFNEFNKSRAVTLNNLCKKYGDKLGKEYYNNYCNQQRYTNTVEYFIKEYGIENGKTKYENFCERRVCNGGWNSKGFSKISCELFTYIINALNDNNIKTNIFYGDNEFYIKDNINSIGYKLDFYDKLNNIVIEFQGDYWHSNPNIYNENYINNFTGLTAKEKWKIDKNKKDFIVNNLNNPIYIEIWESDFIKDKLKIINSVLLYYNIQMDKLV